MKKKKVILTGFLPFGDYKFNPTEDCARYYNSREIIPGIKVIGLILPCTYYGAFKILSKVIDKEKPDAVISTGLSSSVQRIRFETSFRNQMESKYADANEYKPKGIRIDAKKSAEKKLTPQVDFDFLVNLLNSKNLPVEISEDANTFICNSLGYLTTKKILENNLPIRNVFIHIPWTDDYKNKIELEPAKIFLEKGKLYKAIEILIKNI